MSPKGIPNKKPLSVNNPDVEVEEIKVQEEVKEDVKVDPEFGTVKKDYNEEDGEYRLNVIEDYYGGIDVTHLNKKDPRYQYRWLNSSPKNLAIKTGNVLVQKGGWQLCPRMHLIKNLGINEADISADGLYRRGSDLVLAFMPKELYAKKAELKQRRANEPMDAITKQIESGSASEGLQTAKQMGLR